nr:hypothetical protein [Tanacetum cinerariifolium]
MRLFHFSLRDHASNWLERLLAGSITIWEDLTTRFLAQLFPPERTAKLRNDILIFQQHHGESLSEAWTGFKDLLRKIPHHAQSMIICDWRPIHSKDVIDWEFLARQNLDQAFFNSISTDPFSRPQWGNIFCVNELVYWELVREFFASFEFDTSLCRESATLSRLKECNTVKESRLLMKFWPTIRDEGFNVGNTKVASIRDSRVKLAHRCIATTIARRKETTHKVIEIDLYYLYCIYTPEKSLISMGAIMELPNGMCVWPTIRAMVVEEDEDDDEGDEAVGGGTGHEEAGGPTAMKTFLYKALLATVRSRGLIALAIASSKAATNNMIGGRTARSRFKIPINLTTNSICNIKKQSGLAKLLSQAKLIIWDEASMAKRQAVEAVDQTMQDITEKVYYSFDEAEDDTHNNYPLEFLNSLNVSGLPLHHLRLKIGCPIILLRILDLANGLCNGTRLICKRFDPNVINAKIIVGQHTGIRVLLPRIPLAPSEDNIIYLLESVFSHGQLYVALSRGISHTTTKVLVKPEKEFDQRGVYTSNVVYQEVLRDE